MKIKNPLIVLILIFFCSNGFSQNDSLLVVDKKEVKNFHKKIFKLSVDTTIDSAAVYQLRYTSSKGWVQGFNFGTNDKKKYHSGHFLAFEPKRRPIAEILKFPEPSKDSLFLDQTPTTISKGEIGYISMNQIVQSRQDRLFKELKNKTYDAGRNGVIFLGGRYLLVVSLDEYIGNSSWSTVKYFYYEIVK